MQIKLTSDNEWQGKYELLEAQYKEDDLPIFSLGDNLPTGPRATVGSDSFFKTTIKQLVKEDPSLKTAGLKKQVEALYNKFPKEVVANYGMAPAHILQGAEFLRNSSLPEIQAITGNREFEYQLLLDVLSERAGLPKVNYLDELLRIGNFVLYTQPKAAQSGSTGILWLPYNPKADEKFAENLETTLDRLREQKPERIVILTHENSCADRFGSERKAKMQQTIDNYIAGTRKVSPKVTLFCGHLDISAEPIEYNGVNVQPISGTETLILNTDDGSYKKNQL